VIGLTAPTIASTENARTACRPGRRWRVRCSSNMPQGSPDGYRPVPGHALLSHEHAEFAASLVSRVALSCEQCGA